MQKFKQEFIDLTGQKYGNFTVLSYSHKENNIHYWNIKCDCGTILSLCTGHLNQKSKTSYGCLNCGQKKRQKQSYERIYTTYADSAKRRGIAFNLDLLTFKKLIEDSCNYCGVSYSKTFKVGKHNYNHNGIDRVDNNQPYNVDNCVTCCKLCNTAKMDMNLNDFTAWLKRIVNYSKYKD